MEEPRIQHIPGDDATPVPTTRTVKDVFITNLNTTALAFELFVESAHARLAHLSQIRISDDETALAVMTERGPLLKAAAFASLAVEELRGLSETAAAVLP